MESDSGLPNYSRFSSFCGPRIREIKALESNLDNCEHGLRAFQKLPRNMQRRNVSYNPQRLPRYLREKHKREIGNKIKVNKRPCRKYRRRPANLLTEYNRRQRSHIWLETHIWHARRFHMIRKWGYVLPKTPTFKAFRATLRAASESCMIQDVSYECCLEIEGLPSEIHNQLSNMLPPNEAKKLFDSETVQGLKWIETTLYEPHRYPYGVIGDTQIICSSLSWKKSYKIWLWTHPSAYEELLSALIKIFNYKLIDEEIDYLKSTDHDTASNLTCKNTPVQKAPKYTNEKSKLTILKDGLAKFRLIGPASYSLLRKVLVPSQISHNNNNNNSNNSNGIKLEVIEKANNNKEKEADINDEDKSELDKGGLSQDKGDLSHDKGGLSHDKGDPNWWGSFYSNPSHVKGFDDQLAFWNSLKESYSISRRVISLVVRDVRYVLPHKKLPLELDDIRERRMEESQRYKALHPIFDSAIRDSVTCNMKSNHEVNKERENILVPGDPVPLTDEENRIPVMLLQRPGSCVSKLGTGWDIILPCGWATQMLIACVMNGAVVGGQAEEESIMREFLTRPQPHHLPDANAGLVYAEEEKAERADDYFRKPPNCRQNYLVMGVKYPFGINWLEVMKNWNNSCEEFYILRDKNILKFLSSKSCKKFQNIMHKRLTGSVKRQASEENGAAKKLIKLEDQSPVYVSLKDNISTLLKDVKNSLLYVRLTLTAKGSVEPFATICLPTEEDLTAISDDSRRSDILELLHEDKNSKKRTDLKAEHKKNLNHLRRKRKKARNEVLCKEENPLEKHSTMQEALKAAVDVVNNENEDMVKNIELYSSTLNNLWFQNPDETFQSNSREIIGYLTHGGFCTRLGRSGGLGYVVTEALLGHMKKLHMLEEQSETLSHTQILVLTRNPSSLQYKWAKLVILDI